MKRRIYLSGGMSGVERTDYVRRFREAETPDPWDVQPTRSDCERLLKQFDIFTHPTE